MSKPLPNIRLFTISLAGALIWLGFAIAEVIAGPAFQTSDGEVYIVQADDWLSKIAQKYYGDALAYPAIVAATNTKAGQDAGFATITNPDVIEIGQRLWIPASPSATGSTTVAQAILAPVAKLDFIGTSFLAFSPDDQWLGIANLYELQVWDTRTWQLRWSTSLTDSFESVDDIAFSPDGQRLALVGDAGYADGRAYLWNTSTGQLITQLSYDRQVWSVDFSRDGRFWATGSLDGTVILADAASGQPIKEFKHDLMVNSLALSPTGPWLAATTTGSWGPGKVVVWDIFTQEQRILAEFQGPGYPALAFSPDTHWLAAGLAGDERGVAVWETETWPEVARLDVEDGIIDQLEFSADGRWLAGLEPFDERGRIWVWEVPTWRLVSKLDLSDVTWVLSPSPSCPGPCRRWLTFGRKQEPDQPPTYEGQLWDVLSGTLVARIPPPDQVWSTVFSHDGRRTVTLGDVVKVWELTEAK